MTSAISARRRARIVLAVALPACFALAVLEGERLGPTVLLRGDMDGVQLVVGVRSDNRVVRAVVNGLLDDATVVNRGWSHLAGLLTSCRPHSSPSRCTR